MVIGPITLEAKVHIANDAEGTIGAATVGLPVGRPITLEALHRAIGQTLAAMPEGYRLLEPKEFFNKVLVRENTGIDGNFAVPSDFIYDTAVLVAAGVAAYTPKAGQERSGSEEYLHDDEDED